MAITSSSPEKALPATREVAEPLQDHLAWRSFLMPDAHASLRLSARLVSPLTGARRASLLLAAGDGQAMLAAAEGSELQIGQPLQLASGIAAEALRSQAPYPDN